MKLLLAAMACAGLFAQNTANPPAALKHLTVAPVDSFQPVFLSALSIERGAAYPSAVELKGNVEVRSRICMQVGKAASNKNSFMCDGWTVLHADEAVFHEDTGAVEAHGNVTVTGLSFGRKN